MSFWREKSWICDTLFLRLSETDVFQRLSFSFGMAGVRALFSNIFKCAQTENANGAGRSVRVSAQDLRKQQQHPKDSLSYRTAT